MAVIKELAATAVSAVKKKITWPVIAWFVIIVLVGTSLAISTIAFKRTKIDNKSIERIGEIATRLEVSIAKLEQLQTASNAFNREQSDYLYNADRINMGNSNVLAKKYSDYSFSDDDLSNDWLFKPSNHIGGQQPSGNKATGTPH